MEGKVSFFKHLITLQVFKPKNESARRFLVSFVAGFVGMIIALAWNNILAEIISLLAEDFPILSLFGGLIAAILITVLVLAIALSFFNNLNEKEEPSKAEQQEDNKK